MSDNAISQEFGRRVAVMRRTHKITLEQLADRSGVSRSMLSQIERGKANPTLAVAARIADAFGLSIVHLIEEDIRPSLVEVVDANDEQAIFSERNGCRLRTLTPLHMEKHVEFYELTFAPGGELDSDAHFAGTRELLTISSGSVDLSVGPEPARRLGRGDTAHYPADRKHRIVNTSEGETVCFLVVTYA
ncbi:MAG: XRE family transcriptional regulator [Sphingomonadales bacterium]|nr:MAG: XRE family transcriptional regulator [Sphingomonadales bacterium]